LLAVAYDYLVLGGHALVCIVEWGFYFCGKKFLMLLAAKAILPAG
jgi:hypothetical protein